MIDLSRRNILTIAFLAATLSLLMAWMGEFVFGLQPCALCLYQRYIAMVIILVAGLGAFQAPSHLVALFLGFAGLLYFSEATVAFYQVGVELHWFKLPAFCASSGAVVDSIEDLRQQLLAQPPVPCDQVAWHLFGVSMAGYNFLFSCAMGAFCLGGILRKAARKA